MGFIKDLCKITELFTVIDSITSNITAIFFMITALVLVYKSPNNDITIKKGDFEFSSKPKSDTKALTD